MNNLHTLKREQTFMKYAKNMCFYYKNLNLKLYLEGLEEMIMNAKKGWKWFQSKKVDTDKIYTHYGWKIYNEKNKNQGSNVHNTRSIQESGLWKKAPSKNLCKLNYYEWTFDEKYRTRYIMGNA